MLYAVLFGLTWLSPAIARVWEVGPTHVLTKPSQAALLVRDGDTVLIDPGTYADCAVWRASRLTIAARGPGVVIAGPPCFDRGLFLTMGRDITIRGITFTNGRVIYHNGAGVRAYGANLTVIDSRFLNNENGILVGGPSDSVVRVINSVFIGNGSCEGACAHAIYAGAPFAILDVENCTFRNTRTAHHVKSRARTTIVAGSLIDDGEDGTASYLIETPNGGNLLVMNNVMRKGRRSDNPAAAISIGVEGVTNPTEVLIVRDNHFTSDLPEQTLFVRNSSKVPVTVANNVIVGKVKPLDGPGTVASPPSRVPGQ
ncbi:MAG: hypothetical protein AB7O80_22665 [Acetobacteraceae bacterium]